MRVEGEILKTVEHVVRLERVGQGPRQHGQAKEPRVPRPSRQRSARHQRLMLITDFVNIRVKHIKLTLN